jgi:hypothetical protein
MILKFVTILRRVRHELLDLNHTSSPKKLVSLEIPKFATELAAGMDASFGTGTLATPLIIPYKKLSKLAAASPSGPLPICHPR